MTNLLIEASMAKQAKDAAALQAENKALRAEVESLKLAELGAQEAFGHVVDANRTLNEALAHARVNLQAAYRMMRERPNDRPPLSERDIIGIWQRRPTTDPWVWFARQIAAAYGVKGIE